MTASEFKGKVAVVTGASSGIGRSVALALARAGATLVLAARRGDELEVTAGLCRQSGATALVVPTDVTKDEDCQRLIAEATRIHGRVDILINNAGFAIFDRTVDAPMEELQTMMQTNFFGAVRCAQAVLPQMIARRSGVILNMSSIAGIMGFSRMGGYCATKFALTGWSEALRDEMMEHGVSVLMICPSTTETDFFTTAERGKVPGASRLMLSMPPERVARAVLRAIRTGAPRITVPFTASMFLRFKELFPRTAHGMMRSVSRWVERRDGK